MVPSPPNVVTRSVLVWMAEGDEVAKSVNTGTDRWSCRDSARGASQMSDIEGYVEVICLKSKQLAIGGDIGQG